MKNIVLGVALCGVASFGFAANDVILGVKLGREITEQNIVECSQKIVNATCYNADNGEDMFIHLSDQEAPEYIKDKVLMLKSVPNKKTVEMMYFRTHGWRDQIRVLLDLTKKYGKPQVLEFVPTPHYYPDRDLMKSNFAQWEVKDGKSQALYITLMGVSLSDKDVGTVKITTKKFKELEDKKEIDANAQKRSL